MTQIQEAMIRFSDRLGSKANQSDMWFDKMVASASGTKSRLGVVELNELGRQLAIWVLTGQRDVVRSIFEDLELAYTDGQFDVLDVQTFTDELLDGLLVEISQLRQSNPSDVRRVEKQVAAVMGDEVKLLWFPKLSSIG